MCDVWKVGYSLSAFISFRFLASMMVGYIGIVDDRRSCLHLCYVSFSACECVSSIEGKLDLLPRPSSPGIIGCISYFFLERNHDCLFVSDVDLAGCL
jgi:hypothetical protein